MNTLTKSLPFFKKLLPISKPVLESCSPLNTVLMNHAYLIKCGLYQMYAKPDEFRDAYNVFDEMPMRNNNGVFDLVIDTVSVNGSSEDVVAAFKKMAQLRYYIPNVHSLCRVIRACIDLNSIETGRFVHNYVTQNGLENEVIVMNYLISMYAKMGRIDLAQNVFDIMGVKDIVSWNSLITGYAKNQDSRRVFNLFLCLRQSENTVPNVVTFLGLLTSVGHANEVGIGMSIHAHLISIGLYSNVRLGTAVFDMYAKCDRLDFAETVFEHDLLSKSLVSWNALIAIYKKKSFDREAVGVYERMVLEPGVKPDSFSFANVLPAYARIGNIRRIESIHSVIVKRGVEMKNDVVLSTAMLDAYGKCSDVKAAKFLFDCIYKPATATWNALLSAYNISGEIENGLNIFRQMVRCKVSLDPITVVTLLQSCGQTGSLDHGNMIYGFSFLKGFTSHLIVGNAVLDMYFRCGCTKSADMFFYEMSTDNIVTWNTMIYGYMKKNGCSSLGLRIFRQMKYKPDSVTIISLLHGSVVAVLGSCYLELVHAYIMKHGLVSDTQVMNILIDSYAKIGNIDKARDLFMQKDFKRDQTSWNIMIAGCGLNGQGSECRKLFDQMHDNGYAPDAITFISLLSSCSHCGLIEDGCKFFDLMITKYDIRPTMEHWTCVIDMLGRGNDLKEAYDVIETSDGVPLESVAVWGALLSGCRNNMNMEVGEVVGRKLSKMDSGNYVYSSLISNLYSSNKRFDEATEIRKVFGDGKVTKKPGVSRLKS